MVCHCSAPKANRPEGKPEKTTSLTEFKGCLNVGRFEFALSGYPSPHGTASAATRLVDDTEF